MSKTNTRLKHFKTHSFIHSFYHTSYKIIMNRNIFGFFIILISSLSYIYNTYIYNAYKFKFICITLTTYNTYNTCNTILSSFK